MKPNFEIYVLAEPEHAPIRGNALDSGDPAEDRALEDELIARVGSGDVWAWCTVTVSVAVAGVDWTESEHLGCCSYASKEDFIQNSGYFDDMVAECINRLVEAARMVIAAAECEEHEPRSWKLDLETGRWVEG